MRLDVSCKQTSYSLPRPKAKSASLFEALSLFQLNTDCSMEYFFGLSVNIAQAETYP